MVLQTSSKSVEEIVGENELVPEILKEIDDSRRNSLAFQQPSSTMMSPFFPEESSRRNSISSNSSVSSYGTGSTGSGSSGYAPSNYSSHKPIRVLNSFPTSYWSSSRGKDCQPAAPSQQVTRY